MCVRDNEGERERRRERERERAGGLSECFPAGAGGLTGCGEILDLSEMSSAPSGKAEYLIAD